jgi:hypothetical protein
LLELASGSESFENCCYGMPFDQYNKNIPQKPALALSGMA